MSFDLLIPSFLFFLTSYKYVLLFLGIVIEGPILMVASGILIHNGFFSLFPAFLVIIFGDLVGDIIWYYIGYFFAEPFLKKYGKFFKITPEIFERAEELFNKYHVKILLISKVTIGFGMSLATLMAAGATRVSLKKYLMLNFLGEVFLVSVLLSIGYFFGQLYTAIDDALKVYFVVGSILVIGIFVFYSTKYIKTHFKQLR
jgi:membrane protein DedA with SNARE-associated domain